MLWRKVDGVLEAWERDRTHPGDPARGRPAGGQDHGGARLRAPGAARPRRGELPRQPPGRRDGVGRALGGRPDAAPLRPHGQDDRPSSTLLFLDEVQECSDLLTWVKFLIERSNLRIAISGSLLGVGASSRVRSLPVGFLQRVRVNPLDFEEFCRAEGLPPDAWTLAADRARALEPVPGYLHERLMALFRLYVIPSTYFSPSAQTNRRRSR